MPASAVRPSLPPRARRGERGVSIVLAMLVLFVLVVVVFEVGFDANVEFDQARATVETARMRMIADAACQQAQSSLLTDIEAAADAPAADEAGAGGSDGMGGLSGGGGASGGSGDGSGGDGSGEGDSSSASDITDVIARTDSKLDDWQDSISLQPPLGNDFTLWVEVVDEDSKFNILGLWSPDATQRPLAREILLNLLDKSFEGTSLDLSWTDANTICDNLDDWVKGQRGSFDPLPKPALKKTNAEEEAEAGTLDTSVIDDGATNYPLTLGELLMVEGLQPAHLHGFVEDDEFHPGLEEYLTVWSQLEVKPEPPSEDDPFSDSPFTKGSLFDKPSAGSSSGTGDTGGSSGSGSGDDGSSDDGSGDSGDSGSSDTLPTNEGLVNVNTAPLVVLRALAPDDIPTTFLERLMEFRDRITTLRDEGKISGSKSLFDDKSTDSASGESSNGAGSDSGSEDTGMFGDEGDDDPTKYVFEKPEDVIPKVQEEFNIELKVEPDIETQFVSRLAVTSQVFTIKILVQDEKTGRRTSWRSVVWRQQGGKMPMILTLEPLEPFHDARRLKDFPKDVANKSKERFERWTEDGYRAP